MKAKFEQHPRYGARIAWVSDDEQERYGESWMPSEAIARRVEAFFAGPGATAGEQMLAARMEFIHAEFRDWFRARAPEKYRTLAMILHDGIRERIGEIIAEMQSKAARDGLDMDTAATGLAKVRSIIFEAIDAEFAAATGFEFVPVEKIGAQIEPKA